MVKLDVGVLRYMTRDEFRVLVAVEMASKNHEIVIYFFPSYNVETT